VESRERQPPAGRSFDDGLQGGLWVRYHANGQLLDEGTYVTGSVGSLVSGHLVIESPASKRSSCTRRIRLTHPVLHPPSTGIR